MYQVCSYFLSFAMLIRKEISYTISNVSECSIYEYKWSDNSCATTLIDKVLYIQYYREVCVYDSRDHGQINVSQNLLMH